MMTEDLYGLLGLPASASLQDIQAAYQALALRFHPSRNTHGNAGEEFNRVAQAYAVLSDVQRRASYDKYLEQKPLQPWLALNVQYSRQPVPALTEPQVLYALLELRPSLLANLVPPPVNVCFVVDRSTSMQGERLEQVKAAVIKVIDSLREGDAFAVVAFSDKAEVIVPAQKGTERVVAKAKVTTLNAQGGTEMLQGLLTGLTELHRHLKPETINHLIILTDGHTYGDESECLMLAALAATDGITISGFGIGEQWNDKFLDELAGQTGGQVVYISESDKVQAYIRERMHGLGNIYAEQVLAYLTPDPGVKVELAFRVSPDAGPLPLGAGLRLGSLPKQNPLSVLLKFVLPATTGEQQPLGRLTINAQMISGEQRASQMVTDLQVSVTTQPAESHPPSAITEALSKLAQVRLQERAWEKAAAGDLAGAFQSLKTLSTRLLASGQTELARVAIAEAKRFEKTQALSEEAKKTLKYGTRALIGRSPIGTGGHKGS